MHKQKQGSGYRLDMIPEISVLLPTYRRPDALLRTLEGLEQQSIGLERFEIVVVDDGSQDSTERVLRNFAEHSSACFSYTILEENGGPARARNAGLAMCRGKLVLIIGDDIEPETTLLERHLLFHNNNPEETGALLGHVSFPEQMEPNAFMRWLETGGRKYFFNYLGLKPMQQVGPIFFYTCNVSVKRSLLDKSGWFDESFPYASHEDLELGFRLADKGMQLYYDPEARGYHWHMLSVQGIARRVYLMGYSADIFWAKVGDTGSWARKLIRKGLTSTVALPCFVWLWQWFYKKEYRDEKNYPLQWKTLLFLGFFVGLADASSKRTLRL